MAPSIPQASRKLYVHKRLGQRRQFPPYANLVVFQQYRTGLPPKAEKQAIVARGNAPPRPMKERRRRWGAVRGKSRQQPGAGPPEQCSAGRAPDSVVMLSTRPGPQSAEPFIRQTYFYRARVGGASVVLEGGRLSYRPM